ncbi:unnamed protein product [Calicophoron daubneyi]|uniref:Biogenesis of lysosome-related organelles complex 1 subunit 2 n=1 Tax=Calicophoron daubneyi TaxID=300641 RepID=A0AAV2T2Q2_CALDB
MTESPISSPATSSERSLSVHSESVSVEQEGLESEGAINDDGRRAASRAFRAIADYLACDLDSALLDFSILTKMNEAACNHYKELGAKVNNMAGKLAEVNQRYTALKHSLDAIYQFDDKIRRLENSAEHIDACLKEFELRLKQSEQK